MFLCVRQDRQDLARSSTSFMGRAAAGGAEWKKVSQEKLQTWKNGKPGNEEIPELEQLDRN